MTTEKFMSIWLNLQSFASFIFAVLTGLVCNIIDLFLLTNHLFTMASTRTDTHKIQCTHIHTFVGVTKSCTSMSSMDSKTHNVSIRIIYFFCINFGNWTIYLAMIIHYTYICSFSFSQPVVFVLVFPDSNWISCGYYCSTFR